jgi:hypothetical protein
VSHLVQDPSTVFRRIDKDESGTVDYDEFLEALKVCMYTRMRVFVFIHMYVCVRIHMFVGGLQGMYVYTYAHARIYKYMHVCVCVYIYI